MPSIKQALRSIRVIELNPDAFAIADKLDSGPAHGSLYGTPILVKDNIDTGDQMLTSVGSLAFTEPAPQDADLVARLRRAGAVILGKTNPSEWVNFRSSHGISGWSARGGQTRNPYVLDRTPCSSSAGSAAAVAAGFAVAAIGTETDGSILCPASMNGIVGIKPTLGLVSRAGLVPLSPSQDTAGPMARAAWPTPPRCSARLRAAIHTIRPPPKPDNTRQTMATSFSAMDSGASASELCANSPAGIPMQIVYWNKLSS
jgi:Asp-tRNA(Asn)/Glu-tRNA(Gln) amidotransferase A subunit family amidase